MGNYNSQQRDGTDPCQYFPLKNMVPYVSVIVIEDQPLPIIP